MTTEAQAKAYTARAAERAVVGALMAGYDPPEDLAENAFEDPGYRLVVAAALESRRAGRWSPADVMDRLDRRGDLERVAVHVTEALASHLGTGSYDSDWPAIRDAHAKRVLGERVRGVLATCGDMKAEEMVAAIYQAASETQLAKADSCKTVRDVVGDAVRELAKRAEAGQKLSGVPTGFEAIDRLLGGIQEGVVTILAARPSHGKSSLARSIADNANAAGCGVHVFSQEDTAEVYGSRLLADHSRVDLQRMRNGDLTRGDLPAIFAAGNLLRARERWLMDDASALSSAQIAMRVRRRKKANATRLVVVDYLQLMREKARDKLGEMDKAAEGLAQLAKDENVAVLALSQMNRDIEKRDEKRPMSADLRESGTLEQVARAVIFVVQPCLFLGERTKRNEAEWDEWTGKGIITVTKNTNGKTGRAVLAWHGPTATYRDLAKRSREPGPDDF